MLYKNRTFLELYQKSFVNLINQAGVHARAHAITHARAHAAARAGARAGARASARAIAHALVPSVEENRIEKKRNINDI